MTRVQWKWDALVEILSAGVPIHRGMFAMLPKLLDVIDLFKDEKKCIIFLQMHHIFYEQDAWLTSRSEESMRNRVLAIHNCQDSEDEDLRPTPSGGRDLHRLMTTRGEREATAGANTRNGEL